MAVMATNARREARLLKGLDDYFTSLGQGINAYVERQSRVQEIDRLNAMSDEELLKLGIRRERIAQHVFRDRFVF
ncbi:hypothetical protein CCR83_07895 [Rhodobacter veldkampii DSM 11550]|uniref:DUF1127 domain-containing protein n=1 Tax=Phaeovulum veldkampii DSM 11550 TaxID=1185920 RepID=A0A2T4JHP2_9RHOB|nr:hypothetical protein [Phaeovulum veldkampii]MBK5946362.1 hypothetical protein [Phaeovulum veldkampii DSM 11550]NCU19614.1 hypothetical protein [Candidatus Falkowbacteria bacterium]PTE17435.1 hypothetical protein C5F46_09320 [Phaeovulum veldkampii DSM 11550]TDQ60349.1 hypothetical protein EV658_105127 [Phaeovulum veldkampii DSM 11550]